MGKLLLADDVLKVIGETTGAPRIGDVGMHHDGEHNYVLGEDGELFESSLSRVWQHIEKGHGFMAVSAERGERNKQQNKETHQRLKRMVREGGHGFIEVQGHYVENKGTPQETKTREKSLIIPHDEKIMPFSKFIQHAEKLRTAFSPEQESVLVVSPDRQVGLVKQGKFEPWGGVNYHPNKLGDYFSRMKGEPNTQRAAAMVKTGKTPPSSDKTFVLESFRVPSNRNVALPAMRLEGYIIL